MEVGHWNPTRSVNSSWWGISHNFLEEVILEMGLLLSDEELNEVISRLDENGMCKFEDAQMWNDELQAMVTLILMSSIVDLEPF